jgi:hypothetical protein
MGNFAKSVAKFSGGVAADVVEPEADRSVDPS